MASLYNQDETTTKFPVLNSNNHFAWSLRVKAELLLRDAWEAIVGYEDALDASLTQGEVRRRARSNTIALSILYKTVGDEFLGDIADCTTAREAWKILDDLCNSEGLVNGAMVLKELTHCTKTPEMPIQEYFAKMHNLQKRAAKGGFELSDKQVAGIILGNLPEEYQGFIQSWEIDSSKLSTTLLKSKLITAEKKLQLMGEIGEDKHHAFRTVKKPEMKGKPRTQSIGEGSKVKNGKGDETNRFRNYSNDKRFWCYACGKEGHISKNCPRKKEHEGERIVVEQKKASTAIVSREFVSLCAKRKVPDGQGVWLLDCGASDHMCPRRELFHHLEPMEGEVEVGDGAPLRIEGKGSVMLNISDECGGKDVELKEVLYIPALQDNLISLGQIEEKGCKIETFNGVANIYLREKLILRAARVARLYYVSTVGGISIQEISEEFNNMGKKASRVSFQTWHSRLGHLNEQSMKKISILQEITMGGWKKDDCSTCIIGKMKRYAFPKGEGRKATQLLQRVHSDVMGPISPESLGRCKFVVTFIDEYSRFITAVPIKHKGDVTQEFIKYHARVELQKGKQIKEIQSDQGGEYTGASLQRFLSSQGIVHRKSVPRTPQQNGLSERFNQTLQNIVRCMLVESGVPNSFWGEAVAVACYIINRCPSSSLEYKTPLEVWEGRELKRQDFNHLRTFGCEAWAWTAEGLRDRKFGPRARKCVMIGYEEGVKGYRLWDMEKRKIIISRDVRFREHIFPFKSAGEHQSTNPTVEVELPFYCVAGEDDDLEELEARGEEPEEVTPIQGPGEVIIACENEPAYEGGAEGGLPRRSQRQRNPKACPCCNIASCRGPDSNIPENAEEALSGPDAEKWKAAMEDELANMQRQCTWEIVKRPTEVNVVGSKWVFAIKRNQVGTIVKYKARLVARGFSQVYGVDYMETFSPVIHKKSLRTLLAVAVENEWEMEQLDVVGAYLNSPLEMTVYMEQAPCTKVMGKNRSRYVYKLLKSVYGLRQSGRNWNNYLNKCLNTLGFNQCESDPCVYVGRDIILGVYVDDFLVIGEKEEVMRFKVNFKEFMEVKELGELSNMLSLHFIRPSNRELIVSQEKYVETVLNEFGMSECRGVSMPLISMNSPREEVTDKNKFDKTLYRKAIGCLLYISTSTRPDISCAVSKLSQFCEAPIQDDWVNVKHVLRYLNQTKNYSLHFCKAGKTIQVYSDADFGNDEHDSKSYTGYVITLGGGPIIWRSKKQSCVSTSSTFSEYLAIYDTVTELVWLREFLQEIGQSKFIDTPCVIQSDNQGAMCIASGNSIKDRSKHIRIKYHYIREMVKTGEVSFQFVRSNDNVADMLTKPLSGTKTKEFCNMLNLKEC